MNAFKPILIFFAASVQCMTIPVKRYTAVIVILLLIVQVNIYADTFRWDLIDALSKNDIPKVEQILNAHIGQMSAGDQRQVYNFVLAYSHREKTLGILAMLRRLNIHAVSYDLYTAISRYHHDDVIEFIMSDGAVPNGEVLLLAAEKQRFNFVRTFVEMGVDVNYKYSDKKSYADGMTALLHAARWNSLETVKLLVSGGADINARTKDGETAAAIARENGYTDVYQYLMENGAADIIINNNANNKAAATIQPNASQGIAGVIEGGIALEMGTYRLAGNVTELTLIGTTKGGNILYKNSQGTVGTGYFQIEENTITLMLGNAQFVYRIDTKRAFSGNGETWTKTGK
jgi:hypothetical protein